MQKLLLVVDTDAKISTKYINTNDFIERYFKLKF